MNAPDSAPLNKFVGLVTEFFNSGGNVTSITKGGPDLAHVIKEIDRFYGTVKLSHKEPDIVEFRLISAIAGVKRFVRHGSPEAQALDAFIAHVRTNGEILPRETGVALTYLVSSVRHLVERGHPLTAAFGGDGRLGALASCSTFDGGTKVDYLASTAPRRGSGAAAAALALAVSGHDQGVYLEASENTKAFYEKIGFEQIPEERVDWMNMALSADRMARVNRVVASLIGKPRSAPSDVGFGM